MSFTANLDRRFDTILRQQRSLSRLTDYRTVIHRRIRGGRNADTLERRPSRSAQKAKFGEENLRR